MSPVAGERGPREVLLALLPGLALQALLIDRHLPIQLALLAIGCVATATLFARLGKRPQRPLSALVTAVVLAVALPPSLPLMLVFVAGVSAVALAAANLRDFNPAMAAYGAAAVLATPLMYAPIDATSGATLLTQISVGLRQQQTLREILANAEPSWIPTLLVASAWLGGGLWLMRRGILPWRIPAGLLLGLALCALLPWMLDTDRHASPLLHLSTASIWFAAFFVATEPASAPRAARAQLFYGTGIGAVLYVLRSHGDFPDGIAFAVLLMNFFAPVLDGWHARRRREHAAP